MHSLSELKEFLTKQNIKIKEYNGWQLKVGSDTWTLSQDVFYRNNEPVNVKKDKQIFSKYKKEKDDVRSKSTKTYKWRGISCNNHR